MPTFGDVALDEGRVWDVAWSLHPQSECVKCRECAVQAASDAREKGRFFGEFSMWGCPAADFLSIRGGVVKHVQATHDHKAKVRRVAASNVVILPPT